MGWGYCSEIAGLWVDEEVAGAFEEDSQWFPGVDRDTGVLNFAMAFALGEMAFRQMAEGREELDMDEAMKDLLDSGEADERIGAGLSLLGSFRGIGGGLVEGTMPLGSGGAGGAELSPWMECYTEFHAEYRRSW